MLKKIITKTVNFIAVYFTLMPSITVVLSPLLFIMFLPIGIMYVQTFPWPLLKYIPDPFRGWSSLYYLNYCWKMCFYHSIKMYIVTLSYILILLGSAIFIWGFLYWIKYGKGGVIASGPYRICRHPQYLGIIVVALGFTLLTMRPIANISWLIMTYIYILMASVEEYYIAMEGNEYVDYKKKHIFIIPYIRMLRPIDSKKDIFIYTVILLILILIIIYIAQYRVILLR